MVWLLFALDYHVVDVGIHVFIHQMFEHLGDHSLISRTIIFLFKRHDLVIEYVVGGDEDSFHIIWPMRCYLVVTLVGI